MLSSRRFGQIQKGVIARAKYFMRATVAVRHQFPYWVFHTGLGRLFLFVCLIWYLTFTVMTKSPLLCFSKFLVSHLSGNIVPPLVLPWLHAPPLLLLFPVPRIRKARS